MEVKKLISSLWFAAADSIMKVATNGPVLTGASVDGAGKALNDAVNSVYTAFKSYIMPAILTVLVIIAVVLGVIKGVKLAKAESADQQQEAKKSLITFIIGMGAAILITVIVMVLLPIIAQSAGWDTSGSNAATPTPQPATPSSPTT